MLRVVAIDLALAEHRDALLALLDQYASSAEGGSKALAGAARERLPALLAATPGYRGWLAYLDGQAVGLLNSFAGVSTFQARALVNVHDITVDPSYQRRGIGTALLRALEEFAREQGCCKITLEVLDGNRPAVAAYRKAGFAPYGLDPAYGAALFFEKKID